MPADQSPNFCGSDGYFLYGAFNVVMARKSTKTIVNSNWLVKKPVSTQAQFRSFVLDWAEQYAKLHSLDIDMLLENLAERNSYFARRPNREIAS